MLLDFAFPLTPYEQPWEQRKLFDALDLVSAPWEKEKHDIVKLTGVTEMGWLNQFLFVHRSYEGLSYLNFAQPLNQIFSNLLAPC